MALPSGTTDGAVRFLDFLRSRGGFTTEDVLATLLPLFREVADTHAAGRVAPLEGVQDLWVDDYRVYFEIAAAREPRLAEDRLRAIDKTTRSAFELVGQRVHTTDADAGDQEEQDLLVARSPDKIERPVYVPGYVSWEHLAGHHDALTDLYVLGLLLASVACGLDFTDPAHLETFARHRRNLFAVAPGLNPVLAKNIVRLTELDRHHRLQDLGAVIRSLETYRDQDVDLELDLTRIPGFHDTDLRGRRKLVLGRLRERLFEISRRNRLLYYKPSLQTLNLTFASVPILFDVRSIRAEQLFTWQPEIERLLAEGAPIPLSRYLRFEDAPYVPSVLDKLISEARRDTAEFGFSQLRLVVSFLRWHNLKESRQERIDSPLLLLPVELTKRKGIRDSYVMRATSGEAEVNPVLRYHLKELYGISLPHSIDLSETTLQAFYDALVAQIQASEPGVVLNRLSRPQVEIVYARARRRLDQYRRRLRVSGSSLKSFRDLDYSYRRESYQPLGLRLFVDVVRPSPAPLQDIFRERPVHQPHMVTAPPPPSGAPEEKQKIMAAFREGGGEGNPYSWDFDLCNLTLGNFNYRKMSLVRDYNSLLETDQPNAPFDALFSVVPRPTEPPAPPGDCALEKRFPVVPCDPTQLRAVAAAETGRSYIIQGPPGTGKSQTITNLIADLVARGKRVLFVCEKRAAIDVVYYRLRQRGLHDLACLVHDSQADKKDFVLDLKTCYERLLSGGGDSGGEPARRRVACLQALEREAGPVARFHEAMRSRDETAGVSLRRLILRVIELKDRLPQLSPEEEDDLPSYRLWIENVEALERLAHALRAVSRDGVYSRHPLRALSPAVTRHERPRQALEQELRSAGRLLGHVASTCREHGIALTDDDSLGRALLWARYAATVKPLADQGLLDLLDPEGSASERLRQALRERQERLLALEKARLATRAWRQKLEPPDLAAALDQARELGGLVRFLKPEFWSLRRVLRERYDFGQHAVRPTWIQVLEALRAEYRAAEAVEACDTQAREDYGAAEGLEAFVASLEGVRGAVRELLGPWHLAERDPLPRGTVESARSIRGLVAVRDTLVELERLLGSFLSDPTGWSFGALRAETDALMNGLGLLADWLPCLRELAVLPPDLARAIRTLPLDLPQLEAAVAARTLEDVWRRERDLARFGAVARDGHVTRLERLHRRWLEINAEVVLERSRRRFVDKVALASLPSIRLSREQEGFKRRYNSGRRELEHEFGKTMRYKSARALLAGPAGEVILDLKPVWLMSPVSVSDTVPIDSRVFDVVIFDEASQVPLEEAIPALFRSDQVIVSGDQMQLPPTNFFSATRTGEDVLLLEDEDQETAIEYELDRNSFLAHAARNLPSTLLGWHYRSRSESLISFSNAAFYEGRLLTVPDRQSLPPALGEIRATAPEAGDENAGRVLDRPVSFHFLERGRYEARRNNSEAGYIAHLVKGLLASAERPTLGIVAFSEAQQTAIEAALDRLAFTDADFRARLEEEYEREEEGHFSGLLVKNLENIQGDERDVVILSVCYGPGPDGRMLMNFGPINQSGGEKRLNVAFSRAKKHMAVVSSIQYAEVKNVYNDGANSLRNYLQYCAAMSSGDLRTAATVLRTMNPGASARAAEETRDAVAVGLAHALRERGLEVELGVGQSHFRCDLALRRPGEKAFRAAVFVDGDAYYRETDVLEREVLRPALLRSFGWTVAHVLAKDWYEDPEAVLRRLEKRLEGDDVPEPSVEEVPVDLGEMPAASEPEPNPAPPPRWPLPLADEGTPPPSASGLEDLIATPPPQPSPAAPAPGPPPPPAALPLGALLPGQRRCFELVGGTSRKYWHVTVDGCEMVVSFGRIGTQGQVKRKTFPTPELARREAEALIREKLGKGYREVQAS